MRIVVAFFAVLIISMPVLAGGSSFAVSETPQAGSAAAPATTEVKVGLGIENLDLTGATDSFQVAPDTKIYAWARVADVAPGSTVTLTFRKGDKDVYHREVTIPSVPFRIHAYKTFRSGDGGEWKAVLTGAESKELGSVAFKVEITK